jgi:hypothetical protein
MKLDLKTLEYGGWLYWIFFWVSPAAALMLNIWVQLPGYAVAFMAVAAFIATFRDDIPPFHKLIWCLAVCGLFVAEIRAIRQDKREQAASENKRRDDENKQFAQNLRNLEEALEALRTLRSQGNMQELWTNQLLARQHEKGQFVYAMAASRASGEPLVGKDLELDLLNSGSEPLDDVSLMIMGTGFKDRKAFSVETLHSRTRGPSATDLRITAPGFYLVELRTRFSAFQENLELLPDDKHPGSYIQKVRVYREFDNKQLWRCCPPKDCLNERCDSQ